jgi:hypothetical protein
MIPHLCILNLRMPWRSVFALSQRLQHDRILPQKRAAFDLRKVGSWVRDSIRESG